MPVSEPDLAVPEGVVLGKHPEAGTDHPDVLGVPCQQGKLSLFGDKCVPPDSDHITPPEDHLLAGFMGEGDLKFDMFLADINEGGFAVGANGGNSASQNLFLIALIL